MCAVVSFPYLKNAGGKTDYEPPAARAEGGAVAKTPVKRKTAKKRPLKVAGFVSFTDRNFAMLVSNGHARWVKQGQSAFGFKIVNIKEEGIFTKKDSTTVFVPFGK